MRYVQGVSSFGRQKLRHRSRYLTLVDYDCSPVEPAQIEFDGLLSAPVLVCLKSGTAELRLGNRRTILDPSQVVWIKGEGQCQVTHAHCRGRGCLTAVHLDGGAVESNAEEGDLVAGEVEALGTRLLCSFPGLVYCFHGLLSMTRDGPPGLPRTPPEIVADCVTDLLSFVLVGAHGGHPPAPRPSFEISELARRARELLLEHLGEVGSLRRVAEMLDRSRYHVCRVFHDELGVTTNQYVQLVRISEALHRLGEGEDDLLGLAMDLGYSSHSHFTSVFRRLVGLPPSHAWGRLGAEPGGASAHPSGRSWNGHFARLAHRWSAGRA